MWKIKTNGNFSFSSIQARIVSPLLERLNAYLAQCHYGCLYEKWEILGVVNEGVNYETYILLECWDFHSKNVDKSWDIHECLIGDTYKFEEASCASGMSFSDPCAFHRRSYYKEQLVQSCTPSPQSFLYAFSLCESYQAFTHDTNSYHHVISMNSRLEQLEQ